MYFRRISLTPVAALIGVLIADPVLSGAHAQSARPDYAKAYTMALRCMVFSSYSKDEAHARAAFDAWKRLGQLQGVENARMNVDMDFAVSHETKKFHDDAAYRQQTQVDCHALGWAA